MTLRERFEELDVDRRPLVFLLVLFLVFLGSGLGTILLDAPPANEGNVTATPTPDTTDVPTPVGGGPPVATATSTPDGTDTRTPDDDDTPADTPTETRDDDADEDDDENDDPTTPSPGLEVGDGPLLSQADLVPGQSGRGTLTLRNSRDEDGNLTISALEISDAENGLTEPESAVDSSPDEGELSSHLEVRLAIRDGNGDEEYVMGTDSGYVTLEALPARTPSESYGLDADEEVTLVAEWRLPRSTGNEVQSDGVTVDIGLTLKSIAASRGT